MEKIRKLFVYINLWRILPVYFCITHNKHKEKCIMDIEQWLWLFPNLKGKSRLYQVGYMLLYYEAGRNIVLNRLHRNIVMYMITRLFFKPLSSCYINMPPEKIGGGFCLQHGFSTIIAAKEIGERCRINQQVTVGYNGSETPIIGDDVSIMAGALVIGGVNVGNGARVAAGAVVVKDVPAGVTVVGVPARAIRSSSSK